MKHLFKLVIVIGVGLSPVSHGEPMGAEPSGANPMDNPITLGSPCYVSAAQGKTLSLQIATLAAREVAEPSSADVKRYLDTLRDRYFLVEGAVIDCLATEKAYSQSLMANQGMAAGTAETNAYSAAVGVLQRTVADLPTTVPGETVLDRSLNATLSSFYGGWLKRFDSYENMQSVNGIHSRLREALAQVLQTSLPCRATFRTSGSADCSDVDGQLTDLNFVLDARVADLAPKVAALTKSVKDDLTLKQTYMGQEQQIQSQMMSSQGALMQHIAMAQYLGSYAQLYMSYFQYYLYYGNVFNYYSWYYAVTGNPGAAGYFWYLACCYWNAAGACMTVASWFMNALNTYMVAINTIMLQLKTLHDSEPAVIANIQATELDLNTQKALIIGLKVERL